MLQQRLDLSGAASAAEVAELVRDRLRERPPARGERFVGHGFRDGLWPDAPRLDLLDDVSDEVEIVLVSGDLHCVWLNSRACERFGFAGHPTGLLREYDAVAVTSVLADIDAGTLDAWAHEAARAAAARGVTEVVELEWAANDEVWARRVGDGNDLLRVHAGVYPDRLDAVIARGLRTGDPIEGTGGLVRMGPLKIITDGSLNTRTAFCHAPYPGHEHDEHPFGLVNYDLPGLIALMRRGAENGLEPAVHAIGDAANRMALDAFAELGIHGAIEHAQLVDAEDFPRFARLGVVASVQPEHAMDDRDVAEAHWPGRTDRAFAFESLVAAGAEIALGSDAPVAPLDPWISLAAAVYRERDGRVPWHPEQRVRVEAALRASVGARRTRVLAGDVADLVVTDRNPLASSNAELREMPVAATLLGGRFTHRLL
jgi:predicted amidohydrolase YtcJ